MQIFYLSMEIPFNSNNFSKLYLISYCKKMRYILIGYLGFEDRKYSLFFMCNKEIVLLYFNHIEEQHLNNTLYIFFYYFNIFLFRKLENSSGGISFPHCKKIFQIDRKKLSIIVPN